MVQPLHIRNAHIWDGKEGERRDLYTSDVVLPAPANGALEVDLDGYTIFPGLINAHDHLELNHYPRSKFREVYANASEWSADMNARLDSSPYQELRAYPLEDRCFIGGLKNLLCGATTVAHHNPPHKTLFRRDFPVRVLQKYGWSHSFYLETEAAIKASFEKTPDNVPWFIHLAEGTDEEAAGEYQRLKALGCVGANTVIVHGVGMTDKDIGDAAPHARGLVWCPSTNKYLLGTTATIGGWRYSDSHVVIGSDSRLTADGNLLDEIQAALMTGQCDADCIWQAVTWRAAHILRLSNVGHLNPGAWADWIIFRPYERADLVLVVKGGVPQIGDPEVMAKFPHIPTLSAILDGVPKRIHRDLAQRIQKCTLKEPGLEVEPVEMTRRWLGLI